MPNVSRIIVAYAFALSAVFAITVRAQTGRGVVYKPPTGAEKGLTGETVVYENSYAVVIGVVKIIYNRISLRNNSFTKNNVITVGNKCLAT